MSKQNKISLIIILLGFVMIAAYWYYPMSSEELVVETLSEQIILPQSNNGIYKEISEVKSYLKELKEVIRSGKAILPLQDNELSSETQEVQKLLLENTKFIGDSIQKGKLLHSDMMRITPAIVSSLNSNEQTSCKSNKCYIAEKYNFVTNATTQAIVNYSTNEVLSVKRFENRQPDISLRLTRIAKAIALKAPEIRFELGKKPSIKDMSMANVRGALKESPCENSKHLCVAPTFADHEKEQALWAVVDLTELKLSAAKWAGLGKTTTPACISERTLQNKYIMENYCQQDTQFEKNGWKFTYRLTGSDGLEVRDASFNGVSVFTSAKTVDWHVSYQEKGKQVNDNSNDTIIAGRRVEYVQVDNDNFMFGYNDAMGCPMFSTSVVLPFNEPQIKPLANNEGFKLTQDFRNPKWPMACNYRYENQYEFYDDGSFRILAINKGRGCGINAIYRPVMRIDMAVDRKEVFSVFNNDWVKWETEKSQKYSSNFKQFKFKINAQSDANKGYYIVPNTGQFNDQSRGDFANVYATKFHPDEGDQDLLTLGSCCDLNDDGVERYLSNQENIDGENIVLWYVPRIHNDAREGHEYCWADTFISDTGNLEIKEWPCIVGPKFIPINLN